MSLDGKTHEEVVLMLKDAGDIVTLKVKHHKGMAYYLRRGKNKISEIKFFSIENVFLFRN